MRYPTPSKQRGSVLIVALLILMILTMLGVTALSNMTVEERMAANFQRSETGFQAAEAAIAQVVFDGSPEVLDTSGGANIYKTNPGYSSGTDPFLTAGTTPNVPKTVTAQNVVDPSNLVKGLTVATTLTYQGSTAGAAFLPGEELGTFSAFLYNVQSTVTVGTGRHAAKSIHSQVVALIGPAGPS